MDGYITLWRGSLTACATSTRRPLSKCSASAAQPSWALLNDGGNGLLFTIMPTGLLPSDDIGGIFALKKEHRLSLSKK